jgi:hypothetical protein
MNDVEYTWEKVVGGQKRKPFAECPHCGEYDFTVLRKPIGRIFKDCSASDSPWKRLLTERRKVTVGYEKREVCYNCDYSTDWQVELKEEFEGKLEIRSTSQLSHAFVVYTDDIEGDEDGGD